MEEILNRVKFTFSSAASNAASIASTVQQYLPGNPIYREYDVTKQVSSAGKGLLWKVYEGYRKSNKEEVSLFIFEKKQIEKVGRTDKENILNVFRKAIGQLTRIRHPQILTVQHPLEESRELLAFATEPVFASLANTLGNHSNIGSPIPPGLQGYTMHDVEIKYGILQLSEGLAFLHDSVKLVHRCLTPETIIVNKQGAWKLFGFDHCIANTGTPEEPIWPFHEYDLTHAEYLQPDLDFMAPEYVASRCTDPKVDLYCLGITIHALYNGGKPLHRNYNDFPSYRQRALEKTSNEELSNIPKDLKPHLTSLLQFKPSDRPTAGQFSKIAYFNDVTVNTLRYLDKIFQWDNLQKSKFYKKLPQIIPHLPHRMAILRVIPSLYKECVNPSMVPFVLPVMLQVAETATTDEYVKHMLPYLKPIMKITEPIQVMMLLLHKMELLLSKTPAADIEAYILPLTFRALECNTQQIQELCLAHVPQCVAHCAQLKVREEFLPRIQKLCLRTDYLSVRVRCLICVGKIIPHVEKWAVPESVFEFLTSVPSKESAVVMAVVGIYRVAFGHKNLGLSKESLGNKVIPALMPLSIENSLSVAQHTVIMTLIREMIGHVEEEHRKKLKQLDDVRTEQEALKLQLPGDVSSTASSPGDFATFFPDCFETQFNSADSISDVLSVAANANQNSSSHPQEPTVGGVAKSSSLSANWSRQVDKLTITPLSIPATTNAAMAPTTMNVAPPIMQVAPPITQMGVPAAFDPWAGVNFDTKRQLSAGRPPPTPISNGVNHHQGRVSAQPSTYGVTATTQGQQQPMGYSGANFGPPMAYTNTVSPTIRPREEQRKALSAAEISEFLQ